MSVTASVAGDSFFTFVRDGVRVFFCLGSPAAGHLIFRCRTPAVPLFFGPLFSSAALTRLRPAPCVVAFGSFFSAAGRRLLLFPPIASRPLFNAWTFVEVAYCIVILCLWFGIGEAEAFSFFLFAASVFWVFSRRVRSLVPDPIRESLFFGSHVQVSPPFLAMGIRILLGFGRFLPSPRGGVFPLLDLLF